MKEPKQLSVSAIENGTVIDHIPAKASLRSFKYLDSTDLIIKSLSEQILKVKSWEKSNC